MTTHETTARQLAADTSTLPISANTSARQGDLILRKISGDAPGPLPAIAILLAEGNHGEHWAVGPCALDGDVLAVGPGVVVAHTDKPEARHRAIALEPGMWTRSKQREIGLDLVVQKVVD